MKKELIKVTLRNNALYIDSQRELSESYKINTTTSLLVANVAKLGFGFSESLLQAINQISVTQKKLILERLKEVMGVDKSWMPLVRGWDTPTGESSIDHIWTYIANLLPHGRGVTLPCGDFIPEGTFPLERYNGCPYCGMAFDASDEIYLGQGSKLIVLELYSEKDISALLRDLLLSKTALDATQVDSLQILMRHFALPTVAIEMKETLMLVIDELIASEKSQEASRLFGSPQDILRYLWYKKTGLLQLVEPKTIVERRVKNDNYFDRNIADKSSQYREDLKLKYSRTECKMVAKWLNDLKLNIQKSCELMHPKREIWVRFIRALRLAEYSKRKGFEKLAKLLDTFYNQRYSVWQGELNQARYAMDQERVFEMLKERPSVFARSLFSTMLWFGSSETLREFREVSAQIPARLLATLSIYSGFYFDKSQIRSVKALGGVHKKIPANATLTLYEDRELEQMQTEVEQLFLDEMSRRYSEIESENSSLYIDPMLYKMPLAIGDRSETVQDIPSALMGSRFTVEGSTVRLFMEWGKGLPAQHLDMDLSCSVAYSHRVESCSYSRLQISGCKHSGDIQSIPHKVGTAEYIDIDLNMLNKLGANYVSFTANAYTSGELSPNLVVGWMESANEMRISKRTGVAYDPSCVQHQIRITQNMSKGLVFGVLDVKKAEIVWIEMSFQGQRVQNLDSAGVEALLAKLESKLNLSIGTLLEIKAQAQGLELVEEPLEADEIYDREWAINAALVGQLLVD
ncbi:MAG: hypothetical protein U9R27_05755 [Campylobacterota bacterium]|nr:hypothetical protein [Campylobacterota bacterium]